MIQSHATPAVTPTQNIYLANPLKFSLKTEGSVYNADWDLFQTLRKTRNGICRDVTKNKSHDNPASTPGCPDLDSRNWVCS
jgi:hypothetical protein